MELALRHRALDRRTFEATGREIERHWYSASALRGRSTTIRRVSADYPQQLLETPFVLDATEFSRGFDKAKELPPGLYRKLHPWQFIPANRLLCSARPVGRPML